MTTPATSSDDERGDDERERVVWPEPREDPPEEPAEPWARPDREEDERDAADTQAHP
jgi:hypothetical protein